MTRFQARYRPVRVGASACQSAPDIRDTTVLILTVGSRFRMRVPSGSTGPSDLTIDVEVNTVRPWRTSIINTDMMSRTIETRERIRSAARTVMARADGDVSLREVAREAQLSPSALYKHFDSKAALVEDVTFAAVERFSQSLWRAIAPLPVGSFERLARMGHAYIEFAESHPADYALLFSPRGSGPRALSAYPERAGFGLLVQCVEEAMGTGALRRADPALVALLLWTRTHGIVQLLGAIDFSEEVASARGEGRLHAFFDASSTLLFAGLKQP
jgi:AcrR family transcriptional regulator